MTGRVCMSRLDAAWLVLHAGWPRWLILDSYHTEGRIPESPCLLSFLHVQSLVVAGVDAVISSVPFVFVGELGLEALLLHSVLVVAGCRIHFSSFLISC